MKFLIASILITTITLIVMEVIEKRKAIKDAGDRMDLEIINSYNQENDKSYWNYYGQGSRQKVIGREDNLIVVNFKNQDQLLANSLKKAN